MHLDNKDDSLELHELKEAAHWIVVGEAYHKAAGWRLVAAREASWKLAGCEGNRGPPRKKLLENHQARAVVAKPQGKRERAR